MYRLSWCLFIYASLWFDATVVAVALLCVQCACVMNRLLFYCVSFFSRLAVLPLQQLLTHFRLSMLFFEYTLYQKHKCFTHGFYIYNKQSNNSKFFDLFVFWCNKLHINCLQTSCRLSIINLHFIKSPTSSAMPS